MSGLPSYKSKQFLWLVLKLLIVIICGYFIYDILIENEELKIDDFYSILTNSEVFSIKNILFLLIFTLFNWFLEIKKWQILATKIEPTSWANAAKQSLSSLTFSLITPNRIGEYGAKAVYFEKSTRKNILLLNFIGNFHQLMVTIFIGVIALVYLKFQFKNIISESIFNISSVLFILFPIIVILLNKVPSYKEKRLKVLNRFNFITKKLNFQVAIISTLRYLVFSHQFYFLLLIFNIELSYWDAMMGISCMYFLSSIVPMLSLFDFALKGSIAVFLFGFFDLNPLIVLSVTTIMWFLNFAFPAIIGSYFVLRFKPIQS